MDLVWIGDDVIVNLEGIEHVRFEDTECRILFRSGEELKLKGDESESFRTFLGDQVKTKAGPAGKVGARAGFPG